MSNFDCILCETCDINESMKSVSLFSEYDPTQPPKLNEKVLKDKRKKLKETFDRVFRLYVSLN